MSTARFVAFAAAVLLSLALLLAVLISLLDRLGGAAGFVSSFYWSLVLLAILTPWRQILGGSAAGALYGLDDLLAALHHLKASWGATPATRLQWALYYGRFVGAPVVALLVWLACQLKFARGYRSIVAYATRPSRAPIGVATGQGESAPETATEPSEPAPVPGEGE